MGCGASSEAPAKPARTGTILRQREGGRRSTLPARKKFLMSNAEAVEEMRELRTRSHYIQVGPVDANDKGLPPVDAGPLLNPRFGDEIIREEDGDEFRLEEMHGFRVYSEESDTVGALQMARARLTADLAEVVKVLPTHMVEELRRWTAVFLCNEDRCEDRRIGAHCWQRRGAESKFMAVEVNFSVYVTEGHTNSQPGAILHELLHVYHAAFMERVDPIVQRAFIFAKKSGRYLVAEENGEVVEGAPLAADNPYEYFAEVGEAFFSSKRFTNDAFPYVHPELFRYDPVGYRMMELACEVQGSEVATRYEFPAKWFIELSKLFKGNDYDLISQMRELDVDQSGELSEEELAPLWRAVAPEADMDKLTSAILFADVDNNGTINYKELVAWLTAEEGSFLGSNDHTHSEEKRELHRKESMRLQDEASTDVALLTDEVAELNLPSIKDVWNTPDAKFHRLAAANKAVKAGGAAEAAGQAEGEGEGHAEAEAEAEAEGESEAAQGA